MKRSVIVMEMAAVILASVMISSCTSFGTVNDEGGVDVVDDVASDTLDSLDDGVVVPDMSLDVEPDVELDVSRDVVPDETTSADSGSEPVEETVEPDVEPGDSVSEVTDNGPTDLNVPESDVCIPQCGSVEDDNLRECGEDGCGDVCGYCGYGYACDTKEGVCIEICIPDCLTEGKQCGDDGCMGSCGECGVNYKCGDDYKCHPDVCEPDCVEKGKECGDDGCGGSCGTCGESEVCSVGGLCAPGACFGVDKERNTCSLDGQYLYICQEVGETESLLKIDCYAKTGPECGTRGCDCHYNTWSGMNECIEKPPCIPDCEGKECGDDGCGGLCDTCVGGWRCTSQFTCRPMDGAECVWIDWVGTCWDDNWLYTCSSDSMGQGQIIAEDCTAQGKICYYNLGAQQYICGTI